LSTPIWRKKGKSPSYLDVEAAQKPGKGGKGGGKKEGKSLAEGRKEKERREILSL